MCRLGRDASALSRSGPRRLLRAAEAGVAPAPANPHLERAAPPGGRFLFLDIDVARSTQAARRAHSLAKRISPPTGDTSLATDLPGGLPTREQVVAFIE